MDYAFNCRSRVEGAGSATVAPTAVRYYKSYQQILQNTVYLEHDSLKFERRGALVQGDDGIQLSMVKQPQTSVGLSFVKYL